MKQRIITALIGLAVLGVVLFFYETMVLNVIISLVSAMAVYEVFKATGYTLKEKSPILIISLIYALITPIFINYENSTVFFIINVLVLLSAMLIWNKTVHFEQVGFAFLFSNLVVFSFRCIIFIREIYQLDFVFYFLIALGGAWLADTFAYFFGRAFGKHKLAPNISPKKTIEGSVAGFIGTVITFVGMALLYENIMQNVGTPIAVYYIELIILGALLSVIGMIGDLVASLIKRQCKIKDFGSLLPGHGGIMDRCDSVIFVLPVFFLIIYYFPLVLR